MSISLFLALTLATAADPKPVAAKAEPAARPAPAAPDRSRRRMPLMERVIGDGSRSGVQAVLPFEQGRAVVPAAPAAPAPRR
jgi:hypothetical protein